MFEGIGKINAYAQQRNTKIEAKYKMKTGQNLRELLRQNAASYSPSAKKTNNKNPFDTIRKQSITQKLQSGKRLSTEEMNYLRENDQASYQKAKKAQKAREELENNLRRAKTKNEARQMMMQAQMNAVIRERLEAEGGGELSADSFAAGLKGNSAASFDAPVGADAASVGEGSASNLRFTEVKSANVENTASVVARDASETAMAGAQIATAAIKADLGAANNTEGFAAETSQSDEGNKNAAVKKGKNVYSPQEIAKMAENASESKAPDIDDTIMVIFATLADSWKEFVHSDRFKAMPEDETQKNREEEETAGQINGKKNKPVADPFKGRTAHDYFLVDAAARYKAQQLAGEKPQ